MFNSVGRLGHDRDGNGGMEGRITVCTSSPGDPHDVSDPTVLTGQRPVGV